MLKKIVVGVVVFVMLLFLGAQLVRPDMTNPPVEAAMTIDGNASIPPEVKPIFKKACADCHTNETKYPWYSQITPVNWWLQDHINEGRQHMNLSEAMDEIDDICKEVTKGEMPLPSYTWGHPEAVLTAEEKQVLCNWASAAEGGNEIGEQSVGKRPVAKGKGGEDEDDER
jgi:hypothetical protein